MPLEVRFDLARARIETLGHLFGLGVAAVGLAEVGGRVCERGADADAHLRARLGARVELVRRAAERERMLMSLRLGGGGDSCSESEPL